MFSKRHYEHIARSAKEMRGIMAHDDWRYMVTVLAQNFAKESAKFDNRRFLTACGAL